MQVTRLSSEIEQGRYRYTEPNGNAMWVSPVIGAVGSPETGPQAFLLEQGASLYTGPHFHVVNQYQIFVRGSCRLGRRDVRAPFAHWVDPYTTYGPIVPGPDGVAFYTLRMDGGDTQHYMPASRHEKRHRSGRNLCVLSGTEEIWRQHVPAGMSRVAAAFGPAADGLATYIVKAGPGAVLDLPDCGAKGQYWLVLQGAITVGGRCHEAGSVGLRTGNQPWRGVAEQSDTVLVVATFPGDPGATA